ncbi:MAG: type II secretion system protein [Mollicutes bacterium]|nr:type II secretion system protein [Mollicutes bacterium]
MVRLNNKGFTLVELLAVMVVLAIIMIIAIPSVMSTMSDAQRGMFKIYAEKVLNKAQEAYQSDVLLGTTSSHSKNYGYCYSLREHLELGESSQYHGYVIITVDSKLKPTFYVTLTDTYFSITNYTYADLTNPATFAAASSSITDTCPATFTP